MEKIKMVLAGNRMQFENYLNENGLTDSQAKYVYEPRDVTSMLSKDFKKKNLHERD